MEKYKKLLAALSAIVTLLWVAWFSAMKYWSISRPYRPTLDGSFSHYLKTPFAVVYLSDIDAGVNSSLQYAAVCSAVVLIGIIFWIRIGRSR